MVSPTNISNHSTTYILHNETSKEVYSVVRTIRLKLRIVGKCYTK